MEKSRFTRVDADVIDRLIVKDEQKGEELPESKRQVLTTVSTDNCPNCKNRIPHRSTTDG